LISTSPTLSGGATARLLAGDDAERDAGVGRSWLGEKALREVAIYIKAWQAMHPDVHAHVMGESFVEG